MGTFKLLSGARYVAPEGKPQCRLVIRQENPDGTLGDLVPLRPRLFLIGQKVVQVSTVHHNALSIFSRPLPFREQPDLIESRANVHPSLQAERLNRSGAEPPGGSFRRPAATAHPLPSDGIPGTHVAAPRRLGARRLH